MNKAKAKAILEEARARYGAAQQKISKALSLRTRKLIVRYGKDAQYPVCQAALSLWSLEAELATRANDGLELENTLNRLRASKDQARSLLDLFYEKGKQKEAIQADTLLRNIGENLKKTQECYRATTKLFKLLQGELFPLARAQFKIKRDAVTEDAKARKALRRLRKSWKADADRILKAGERRTLRLLEMAQKKVIRAKWAKDGYVAGWTEVALGSDRPLNDESWQGRLTAREVYSHIAATDDLCVAGDKDAKEIRRTARGLEIRLAEDQRGRKWKEPRPKKQELKKPRGRPRTSVELVPYGDTDIPQGGEVRRSRGTINSDVEREITRLKRVQKGLGLKRSFLGGHSKWKPEGKIKGRTEFFAKWMDSLAAI